VLVNRDSGDTAAKQAQLVEIRIFDNDNKIVFLGMLQNLGVVGSLKAFEDDLTAAGISGVEERYDLS